MIPLPYLALAVMLLMGASYGLGRVQGGNTAEDACALKAAQASVQAVQRVREKEAEFSVEVAKIDAHYRQVIDNANVHTANLARQLESGAVRLRPAASCLGLPARPAAPIRDHVPTSSGSGDPGIAVRAVAIAREADAQLRACQAYARTVSGG